MNYTVRSTRPALLCCWLLIASAMASFCSHAAITWHPINANIQFLQQPSKLRFYDANQVLIEGEKCALLFDSGGNFTQVEQLADTLTKRLRTPLCYLVASHSDSEHLLGMAVLQNAFPNAQLIVHEKLNQQFTQFQTALANKFEGFQHSIALSLQRLADLSPEQQKPWQQKLALAKQRLTRWLQYKLLPPKMVISSTTQLDLGQFPITITPYTAHPQGNLTITSNGGKVLIAGELVSWLPYPGQANLSQWSHILVDLMQQPKLTTILAGHGNMLTPQQLSQPEQFLRTIEQHVRQHPKHNQQQLLASFPPAVLAAYQADELDKETSQLFLQTGLLNALKAK